VSVHDITIFFYAWSLKNKMSVRDTIGPGTGTESIDVYNLTVNGEFLAPDTFKGSARYNILPTPARTGIIDGYLIFATDPNPSYVPFNTGAPQFGLDYSTPGNPPQFTLTDSNTLTCNIEGDYILSMSMTCVGTMPCSIIFQILSSTFPFIVGAVPPVLSALAALVTPPFALPPPYNGGFGLNGSCNAHLVPGQFVRVAYLCSANAEISLTSNLSVVTVQNT
jgi:hypothetical protein